MKYLYYVLVVTMVMSVSNLFALVNKETFSVKALTETPLSSTKVQTLFNIITEKDIYSKKDSNKILLSKGTKIVCSTTRFEANNKKIYAECNKLYLTPEKSVNITQSLYSSDNTLGISGNVDKESGVISVPSATPVIIKFHSLKKLK